MTTGAVDTDATCSMSTWQIKCANVDHRKLGWISVKQWITADQNFDTNQTSARHCSYQLSVFTV